MTIMTELVLSSSSSDAWAESTRAAVAEGHGTLRRRYDVTCVTQAAVGPRAKMAHTKHSDMRQRAAHLATYIGRIFRGSTPFCTGALIACATPGQNEQGVSLFCFLNPRRVLYKAPLAV